MPLATAAPDARAARRVSAAAMAAALQGLFYWFILHEAVEPTVLPNSKPLEVTIVATARRLPRATFPRKRRQVKPSRQRAPKKALSSAKASVAQPITVASPAKPAARAPIDWQDAMQDEVPMDQSRSRVEKLQFGFPEVPASVPAVSQFGWDYARTHRVESLPAGGMLIDLNDRCALVVYVLFIPVCKIGRIPANGGLFEQLHDPRNDSPSGLP